MSKYAKPKRNVQNFNAENFEAELVKSTTDVLKITKNEIQTQTQTKLGFYVTPNFHYTGPEPISNFISNNTLSNTIDSNMQFITAGTYHIRYMMNLRSRVLNFCALKCSNSDLQQIFKIDNSTYQQVIFEGLVYFDVGDKLEFTILDNGGNPLIVSSGNLTVLNSILFTQLISTENILVV
jgi:hypothetical protein